VNWRHLSWKTRVENKADMLVHGTRIYGEQHYAAKLSDTAARRILELKGRAKQKDIAERFGVSQSTVLHPLRKNVASSPAGVP